MSITKAIDFLLDEAAKVRTHSTIGHYPRTPVDDIVMWAWVDAYVSIYKPDRDEPNVPHGEIFGYKGDWASGRVDLGRAEGSIVIPDEFSAENACIVVDKVTARFPDVEFFIFDYGRPDLYGVRVLDFWREIGC